MNQTLAVVVAGDVARGTRESGARQRLDALTRIASTVCDEVRVIGPGEWGRAPALIDLVIGQSWPTTLSLRRLHGRSNVVWFDACDSTVALRTTLRGTRRVKSLVTLTRDIAFTRGFTPDVVTYITALDAANDARLWSQQPLVLPIHWPKYSPLPFDGCRRIVFVGDGRYLPNREAALWAIRVLVPSVRALGMRIPLWIYGDGYDLPASEGVHLVGYEPDPSTLYREGDIHIAPLTSGAGMNSKVAIPMLAGLPVVTTQIGIEGLRAGPTTTVCKLAEFADAIAQATSRPVPDPVDLSLNEIIEDDDSDQLLRRLRQGIHTPNES